MDGSSWWKNGGALDEPVKHFVTAYITMFESTHRDGLNMGTPLPSLKNVPNNVGLCGIKFAF